jgi:hypothetical protein
MAHMTILRVAAGRRSVGVVLRKRPKHPNPDLEELLREVEKHGWTVTKSKQYFKTQCRCPAKHQTWVHLTPSNPNYTRNQRKWFERQSCWKDDA